LPGAAGTGLAEGETGLCEAKTGHRRWLACISSLASTDAPQCNASCEAALRSPMFLGTLALTSPVLSKNLDAKRGNEEPLLFLKMQSLFFVNWCAFLSSKHRFEHSTISAYLLHFIVILTAQRSLFIHATNILVELLRLLMPNGFKLLYAMLIVGSHYITSILLNPILQSILTRFYESSCVILPQSFSRIHNVVIDSRRIDRIPFSSEFIFQ